MAVPISVTVMMPMTMPSVVSTERNLFARMALHEIARPSRSSVRKVHFLDRINRIFRMSFRFRQPKLLFELKPFRAEIDQ